MKKYLTPLIVLLTVIQTSLSAFSIGRDGDPYEEAGIQWQPVKYDDKNSGFKVSLPSSPTSFINGGNIGSYSEFNKVHYQILTSMQNDYKPPKTEKEFLKALNEIFCNDAVITSISTEQKTVKYAAELVFSQTSKVVQVYCSKNNLYWALVDGDDLSLAPIFFNTVQITK